MRNGNGNLVANIDRVFLSKENDENKVARRRWNFRSNLVPLALVVKATKATKLAVEIK